jgi:hypothetical protein
MGFCPSKCPCVSTCVTPSWQERLFCAAWLHFRKSAWCQKQNLVHISGIAELERGNGIVEAIDPVLFAIFRMVAHVSDELRRNPTGGESQDTPVNELAFCQEFDIRKDFFLAGFGRGLTVRQKLRGGDVSGMR